MSTSVSVSRLRQCNGWRAQPPLVDAEAVVWRLHRFTGFHFEGVLRGKARTRSQITGLSEL